MNTGFWACFILVPLFFAMALLFAFGKEKAAKLVSGFNFHVKSGAGTL